MLTFSLSFSEGESGLGKSTLVNSLFLTDLYKDRKLLNAEGEEAFPVFFHFVWQIFALQHIKKMVCLCRLSRANHTNSRNHQTHSGYRGERRQTEAHHCGHPWLWGCCKQHWMVRRLLMKRITTKEIIQIPLWLKGHVQWLSVASETECPWLCAFFFFLFFF